MDAWLGPGTEPPETERCSILSQLTLCSLTTVSAEGAPLARIHSSITASTDRELLLLEVAIQRMECWSADRISEALKSGAAEALKAAGSAHHGREPARARRADMAQRPA